MPDVFDQLAGSQQQPTQTAPPVTAPQPAPPSQSQQPASGQPDIFSQLAAGSVPDTQALSAPVTISAAPGSMPGDSIASKLSLWADNLKDDILHGSTKTELGRMLKASGAQPLANGQGEDVGAFFGSPVLGSARVVKGGAELTQSGRRWQGTKDVVGGALDASSIPGSFVAPEAGELAGAGTDAALTQAGKAARAAGKAVREPFSLQAVQDALEGSHADIQKALETSTRAIQDDWHGTVRGIFDKVAAETGVTPEKAESLHDVAANVSAAVKAKAQGLYRQADDAVGGVHFQNFQGAIKNIKDAIRSEVGLDPVRDAQLQQRLADAEAGHEAAKEQLTAKGLDPGIVSQADALYRRAMALGDVSKPIQSATSGLRADLASGASTALESLSPAKLANRVNALYDKGRLQHALGEDGSADFLTAIEDTKQRLQSAATAAKQQAEAMRARAAQQSSAVNTRRAVAGAAAGAALGGVPGYALLKHLLGY